MAEGSGQAGAEIEVTADMVAAGARVLLFASLSDETCGQMQEVAESVFRAMLEAQDVLQA